MNAKLGCVALLMACVLARGQTAHEGASGRVVADGAVSAPEIGATIIMPLKCDSSGNIYLQPPLSKVNQDGKKVAGFDSAFAAIDGLTDLVLKSFTVSARGELYQLARTKDGRSVIIRFDAEGKYSGPVTLDNGFDAQQLTVFQDDSFLVSGVAVAQNGPDPEFLPKVALFNRSGRMVKEVDTGDASYVPGRVVAGQLQKDNKPRENDGERHLVGPPELALMESDGTYAYLLRQGSEPVVTVVSASGEVTKRLKLEAPFAGAQVSAFRADQGQILAEYIKPGGMPNGNTAYYLTLYNAETGNMVTEYTRDPDVTGTLACTDWRGHITLLTANEKGSVLLKAVLR